MLKAETKMKIRSMKKAKKRKKMRKYKIMFANITISKIKMKN
jgi:hypothetical protein